MTEAIKRMALVRWTAADDVRPTDWLCATSDAVKLGPYRAVYRLRGPGFDIHIKQNRAVGLRSFAREMLRPIKARREYELAVELSRRGIPTPRALAFGVEGRGPGASWLVTETVADAVPLTTVFEQPLTPRRRQALSRELGRFLAQLHNAGVVHHDLHPGNLLASFDGSVPRLWLIDLHAVGLASACTWPERQHNLVIFNRFFILRGSRSDRLRFWNSYLDATDTRPDVPRQAARVLERLTWESNLRFWAARDRRCRANNRYYRKVAVGDLRGYVVADFDATQLADPDAIIRDSQCLKNGRSSTVVRCTLGGREVVLKRFNVANTRDPWLALVRPTAAVRSWVFGHGLRERGLPTARPLALLRRQRASLTREEYLLTEFVPGAVELHTFVQQLATWPGERARTELRPRMHALARLLRQMHRRGASHRDLKAANLLTSETPGDARFWFIDLVGVRRHARVGHRRKVQNLSRLNASFLGCPLLTRTERLRFLFSYLEVGIRGTSGWKAWWRDIDAATQAKRERNAKSGRPLA